MLLRDRTKKRLRWFIAAVLLIGCIGVAGYFVRDRHLEKTARAGLKAGTDQLAVGDYHGALHNIGPYVRRHPDDVAALFAYAQARREVPAPNDRHISDTLGLLRRVITLDPTHKEASESLLKLYQDCGKMTEALQLAQRVLARDPKNRTAMFAKANALSAGASAAGPGDPASARNLASNSKAARDAAQQYNELEPTDLKGQLLTLELLNRGDSNGDPVKHFERLHEKSPNEPIFTLLLGVAQLSSGKTDDAKESLRAAADMDLGDAYAIEVLVRSCDQLEMFKQSMDVLKRCAATSKDAKDAKDQKERKDETTEKITALFAGRLWELESYEELAQRFDAATANSDPQAAALRCLALKKLGQDGPAQAAIDALKKAALSNASARNWVDVLEALNKTPTSNDAAVIRACQQALARRNNPYVRFFLGEAYLRSGEQDAAIQSWMQARALAPAWAAPVLRLSQVVAAAGNINATRLAEDALKRAPNNTDAMLTLAAVKIAALKVGGAPASKDDKTVKEIDDLLVRVAEASPKRQEILPLRVHLLAATDRVEQASNLARSAMQSSAGGADTRSTATLIDLALISERMKLGLEQELFEYCERTHGLTPKLAIVKASKELGVGHKTQAVQLVEAARAKALTPALSAADKLEWDLAWARVLEMANDPRAKDTWIALADANLTNPQMQWNCLVAASVPGDSAARRRVLDRLKDQYGDRGLRWRLAQAQWLWDGRQQDKQKVAEAALLLNELTREAPHMVAAKQLLADCQVELGQITGAIEQLSSAASLQPQSSEVALKLAQLLLSRNDTTRARTYLDRVAQDAAAPLPYRREAARLIGAQGDPAAGLAALESAYGPTALNEPPADLLLARLYRSARQPQRCEAICKRLLEQSPDLAAVTFAVEFYAAQGRTDDAAKALDLLEKISLKPGEKEIVRGDYALRLGDVGKAAAYFAEATRVAPGNPLGWRQLIRLDMRDANGEKALSTARLGQAAVPADKGFAAFIRQAPQVLKIQASWAEIRVLWGELLDAPDMEKTLIEVITLLPADDKSSPAPASVKRLVNMAAENQRSLSLQILASRACGMAGLVDDATRIATRAAEDRPGDAASAQFATLTLSTAGQWPQALEMGRRWRQATPKDTLPADQMIAAAYTGLNDFAAARDQLTPHMQRALAEPDKFRLMIAQYAHLQSRVESPEVAAALLRPHLPQSAAWRVEWMKLAGKTLLDPAVAAAWMREVEPLAQKGSFAERLTLADGWHAVARRSGDAEHAKHAAALLESVVQDPEAAKLSADETVTIALLQESQGNKAGAEASYRRALSLNPQHVIAQNNLAMILSDKPASLNEALTLAQQAVKTAPTGAQASILDTLAVVQGKRKDYSGAITSIQQAVALMPDNPKYQIRLARMLIDGNQIDRAKTVLDDLNSRARISEQTKEQIKALQGEIESAPAPRAS